MATKLLNKGIFLYKRLSEVSRNSLGANSALLSTSSSPPRPKTKIPKKQTNSRPAKKFEKNQRSWTVAQSVNRWLYQIFQQNTKYVSTTFRKSYLATNQEITNLTSQLALGVSQEDISQEDKLRKLPDSQFKLCCQYVASKEGRWTAIEMLEKDFLRRAQQLDIRDILYIMDCFYFVSEQRKQGVKNTALYRSILGVVAKRWSELHLSQQHVLQLLFYASMFRNAPVELLHQAEQLLAENMDQITAAELGLLCHAFFSINASIKSKDLLTAVAERTLTVINDLELVQLANIMKALRHAGYRNIEFYTDLGDKLAASKKLDINAQSLTSAAHVLTSFGASRIIHDQLFSKILSPLGTIISSTPANQLRVKDLTRILWTLASTGNPCPHGVRKALVALIQGDKSFEFRFPEAMVEALLTLSMGGEVEKDLLDRIFQPEFLKIKRGSQLEQYNQLLLLHDIYMTYYPGEPLPQGTQDFVKSVPKEFLGQKEHELLNRQGLMMTLISLEKALGGAELVRPEFTLSSSHVLGLYFELDQDNKPVSVNSDVDEVVESARSLLRERPHAGGAPLRSVTQQLMDEADGGDILNRMTPENVYLQPTRNDDQQECKRVIVKVYGWNQYAVNKPVLLGRHLLELKLLTMQGYHVIGINPSMASKMDTLTEEERIHLIQELIIDQIIQS